MLFSLIIPVFNSERYLQDCLDSVESQEFDDFEVILIDDGSTDGSSAVCDSFCERFNSRPGRNAIAKVIHQENSGPSVARNRGISEAAGDWLWFIDSDDRIMSDALEVLHERMRFAKGDIFVFQYIKTDEHWENEECIYFRAQQEILKIPRDQALLGYYSNKLFSYKDGWETHTRLYRRDIVVNNDLKFCVTPFYFGEDLVFYAEYMLCVRSAVMLVNYLYYYRQQSSSLMHTLDQKSIIPKLVTLMEHLFLTAGRLKNSFICENFDKVCQAAFSDHIEYKLDELTDEEICAEIREAAGNRVIGKYISAVSGQLEQKVHDRHKE